MTIMCIISDEKDVIEAACMWLTRWAQATVWQDVIHRCTGSTITTITTIAQVEQMLTVSSNISGNTWTVEQLLCTQFHTSLLSLSQITILHMQCTDSYRHWRVETHVVVVVSGMQLLRLRSAIRRHHSPQRAVLSQICCFGERKVVLFQILLDVAEPRDAETT